MRTRAFWLTLLLTPLTLALALAVGSVVIPPAIQWRVALSVLGMPLPDAWQKFAIILRDLRLPHAVLIWLTGSALGMSGAAYQGLFRNPLADPYLIGVASGAGLGAVLVMGLHWPYDALGLFAVPLAAFLFAMLTVLLAYALARQGGSLPPVNLILAGVAISSFAGALTSLLMLRSDAELHRAIAWLLGGGGLNSWSAILALLPYWLLGGAALWASGHALNVLQHGDEQAIQLGLPVSRVRTVILLAASLVTAAAVSFSGIIGFIGLIVPHLARLWLGSDYRRLIPYSLFWGGIALLLADVLARTLIAPQQLPVGLVTALFGAPFFLWVLRQTRRAW